MGFKVYSQKININICVSYILPHLQMQQLERQVIDAERQAEKAFQEVEYASTLPRLHACKDYLA